MNAVSVANKVAEPVIKYTQRILARGLQSLAPHNNHITSTTGPPPPSPGMTRAWLTLQEDSCTQGPIKTQPLDTFDSVLAQKSILGSRYLGGFEKSADFEQSSVRSLLDRFRFE